MPNSYQLFHDQTLDYIHPLQPLPEGEVTISLSAESNQIASAVLVYEKEEYPMSFEGTFGSFDFYHATVRLGTERVGYSFRVQFHDGAIRGYDRSGLFFEKGQDHSQRRFFLTPGLSTPDWAKGAVMYQILVDRFCNGDPSSDVLSDEYAYGGRHVRRVEDWNRVPDPLSDFNEFYGGDLQGVINKLDYLQDLGIDAIYFNPIFVSPSSHKYDIQDYDHVDPHFGRIVSDRGKLLDPDDQDNRNATRYIDRVTNRENLEASDKLFIELVEKAHERGIRVILDGVFNHCGSFNKWLDKERIYEGRADYPHGAYVAQDSPYHDYFSFHKQSWPYNGSYEGWWGYDTLPKLNYEGSEKLCNYILEIAKKWVSPPFNADGWRLDVAADLGHSPAFNHEFWRRFRKAVKEANPEAIILAEQYGESKPWLLGDQWDTVMNYDAFMEPVTYFLTGMEKHSDEYHPELEGNGDQFWRSLLSEIEKNFTVPSLYTAMNELSNHDHSRFLTRTNHLVGRSAELTPQAASRGVRMDILRQAVLMQFTLPGAPTIYYGDEAGLCGFTDPDNRRTYPWGKEDHELIAYHKELIRIHKEVAELMNGSLRIVHSEGALIAYGRFTRAGASLIVINRNSYALTRDMFVKMLGVPTECIMRRLIISTKDGYRSEPVKEQVSDGLLTLQIPAMSAQILRYSSVDHLTAEEFWKKNQIHFGEEDPFPGSRVG